MDELEKTDEIGQKAIKKLEKYTKIYKDMEISRRNNGKEKKNKYKENEFMENESKVLTMDIKNEQKQRELILNQKKKVVNAYELIFLQVDDKLEKKQTMIE